MSPNTASTGFEVSVAVILGQRHVSCKQVYQQYVQHAVGQCQRFVALVAYDKRNPQVFGLGLTEAQRR